MADDVVSVQVTADVGSYVEGMKSAAAATATSMDALKTSTAAATSQSNVAIESLRAELALLKTEIAELRDAGEHGGEGIHSLGGAIKEYRQEIRTEGRYSRFLAGDIASMGLASKGAASEVTSFVAAFAFGGGIGVAIESVKLLVKYFNEGDEAVKKIKESGEKSLSALKNQIADIMLTMSGASQAEALQQKGLRSELEARGELEAKLKEATEKQTQAHEKYLAAAERGRATQTAQASAAEAAADREVVGLKRQLAAIDEITAKKKEMLKPAVAGLEQVDAAKEAADAEKIEAKHQEKMLQLHAQTLDGNEKLEAEYVAKIQAIENNAALTGAQTEAEKTAELEVYRKQLFDFSVEQGRKWAEQEQRWLDANIKAEHQAAEAKKHLRADQDAYQLERGKLDSKVVDEALRRQIQAFREEAAVARQMGDTIGQVFAGIASGSMNAAKAFASLASAGVKALFDIEIKTLEANAITAASTATRATGDVMANAAVASSGAAASQASIPFIGPALAIAAMAAMEAAVLGLLSLIPGAAVGADIPAGMSPFIQAHGSEIVLPRISSDVLRSLPEAVAAFQSGGAGGTLEIHVHNHFEAGTIVDQQTLDNHMQSGAMQQAISRAVRMSKWRG